MAATRLIPLHVNKGKTVAKCLANRTDYSQNAAKTNDGEFISSYECDPRTCDEEFLLSKRQYEQITGRNQKHDVIAYQIRQSFKPGEITPEEANKIGYELAMRFTKGKHAFIVATHVDKAHIHNHIIYNSTTLDCTRKFKDFYFSALAVRRISDILCFEHGMSIIKAKPYRDREKYSNDNVLLTPRCGENAAEVLKSADIEIFKTTSASVKDNIDAFIDGKLPLLDEIHAGFHGHGGN